MRRSEENGGTGLLGLFDGEVKRFDGRRWATTACR